jgi:pimeloyl-ACP methyl ester carboxylesterase
VPPTEPAPPPPATRRVDVADGVGLHCTSWAPGAPGLPFVLVHGLASNARTWEGVAQRVAAAGHPVATVDLRGHGRSDQPDGGYDLATLGDDLLRVLDVLDAPDVLGPGRPVVVGQSMGGNLALDVGRRAGDRLAGVGGVDGGVIELTRRFPDWEECADALAPPRWDGARAGDVEAAIRRDYPSWSEWGVEATMANFAIGADGTVRPHLAFDRHLRLLRSLWEHRPSEILDRLDVPVLLVVATGPADGGPVTRADAQRAVAALGRAQVHHVPNADHDVHVQQPARVSELLLEAARDGFFHSGPGSFSE